MKNAKITRDEKRSFFSGKGFYITLALSIIAVGGAAWIGVNSSMKNLDENNKQLQQEETQSQIVEQKEWDIPVEDETVNIPQSDITKTPEQPKPNVSEGFIMPLKGDTLVEYSGDNVVKSKTLDEWIMHTGIDISAKASTPVKAVSSGKVIEVKNDTLWGSCVVIEHANGYESHYYNLKSAIQVKNGQTVKLGDIIGNVGSTAEIEQKEEVHLHFAMKKDGSWIDPMTVIK